MSDNERGLTWAHPRSADLQIQIVAAAWLWRRQSGLWRRSDASSEIPVECPDEVLASGAKNQIRELIGTLGSSVRKGVVHGPTNAVAIIADMGFAPALAPVDANGVLNVTYAMPTMKIVSFDPKTGAIRIKVTPGEGNTIVSEIATGYLHVYGSASLTAQMTRIATVGFDLTPYLKSETTGEAILNVTLGTHTFFKVAVE